MWGWGEPVVGEVSFCDVCAILLYILFASYSISGCSKPGTGFENIIVSGAANGNVRARRPGNFGVG